MERTLKLRGSWCPLAPRPFSLCPWVSRSDLFCQKDVSSSKIWQMLSVLSFLKSCLHGCLPLKLKSHTVKIIILKTIQKSFMFILFGRQRRGRDRQERLGRHFLANVCNTKGWAKLKPGGQNCSCTSYNDNGDSSTRATVCCFQSCASGSSWTESTAAGLEAPQLGYNSSMGCSFPSRNTRHCVKRPLWIILCCWETVFLYKEKWHLIDRILYSTADHKIISYFVKLRWVMLLNHFPKTRLICGPGTYWVCFVLTSSFGSLSCNICIMCTLK